MYLPFIAAEYKEKAHLYVNPSFGNVKYNKWAAMLQGRAVENGFYTTCVLHHFKDRKGNKGYAFAYDPYGNPLRLEKCLDEKKYTPIKLAVNKEFSSST